MRISDWSSDVCSSDLTLANLTFRLLFEDLGYTNDEIAFYDVGLGFWALLAGVFVGGIVYARLGMKRSVLLSLVLMAISNFSFAGLAMAGHSHWGLDRQSYG